LLERLNIYQYNLERKIDPFSKENKSAADTNGLEAEIDQLVYELYGLTEDEIAIVEASVK
jgi:hypothetical protein